MSNEEEEIEEEQPEANGEKGIFVKNPNLYYIEKKILNRLLREALERLANIQINEKKDRIRIIFEFEFKDGKIQDAIEIRHRRPWS